MNEIYININKKVWICEIDQTSEQLIEKLNLAIEMVKNELLIKNSLIIREDEN